MTDVFDEKTRSAVMRKVRSRDTGPELAVRRLLRGLGRGYRVQGEDLPGKPDIVLRGARTAIFVHGCFWHGHDCKRGARSSRSNALYWSQKIARNRARDLKTAADLEALGWRVLIVWECALRDLPALETRFLQEIPPARGRRKA
jgi:DNA mismatch endonuclease (patch repair protein)